jgi:hypothetical protein
MRYLRPDSIHQWTDGEYVVTTAAGRQVGFARVLTDATWFAWIADVFVLRAHRGGRGKFIMRCITEDLAGVRRVVLGTRDAHGLYAQFGFRPVAEPANWMERMRPNG